MYTSTKESGYSEKMTSAVTRLCVRVSAISPTSTWTNRIARVSALNVQARPLQCVRHMTRTLIRTIDNNSDHQHHAHTHGAHGTHRA